MGYYSGRVSIFVYADDILLVAPSVTCLQELVFICEQELIDLDMQLNSKKSVCMRFGPRFDVPCADIVSRDGVSLRWVQCCRYLGVYFVSGKLFRCDFSEAKSSFFRAFNAIFGKVGRLASEEIVKLNA